MTSLPASIDVAVIGAGAAGVAAARRLRETGASVVVLEARDRVGGRAHTIRAAGDVIDLGCEWLHSADRNPLAPLARELGFTVDEGVPDWGGHVGANFPPDAQKEFRAASDRFWSALEEAARDGGADRPASTFLPPRGRWNGLIQAISSYYNGTELENVSIVDLDRYEDTMVNWTIREGYGALIAGAAAGLPIVYECAATRIDHSGRRIRIDTTQGPLDADAVVVAVPTPLLAEEILQFDPPLPEKTQAAAALPLGAADKIFFEATDARDLPHGHVYGTTDAAETISFDLFPRGRRLVTGYVGGEFARRLEREGARAMEAEARRQLAAMLGAGVQSKLRFLRATAWDLDRYSRGAYSHALPGRADERAALARTVDGRLFFAGEACSRHRFSTAHGAWETGLAAAEAWQAARAQGRAPSAG